MAPVATQKLADLSLADPKEAEKKPDHVDEDHEEDDDDVDVEGGGDGAAGDAKKKKKKKKPKKKKPAAVQTDPPTIGLSKIFRNGAYPVGQEVEYIGDNAYRTSSAEMREKERLQMGDPEKTYNDIRRASEVHRQVRKEVRKHIKPGATLHQLADIIENTTRQLVEADESASGKPMSGMGFPTGLSVNEIAAHYSPNPGETPRVLKKEDVLKVDIGVQVNGRICDSAFTVNFEPTYDKLLEAVKDATETGIREAGIDVRLCDIGEAIQEVMESYEVEVGGKMLPVKSIRNLNGHSIMPYSIHGGYDGIPGKSVPIVKQFGDRMDTTRMEEGEYFAIETFGSTGHGKVYEEGACSHYSLSLDPPPNPQFKYQSARSLLKAIKANFGGLPFSRRYLEHAGEKNYLLALNSLVREGVLTDHPPLVDPEPGAMTAQYEHTILLRPTCKEIVSRGDDY